MIMYSLAAAIIVSVLSLIGVITLTVGAESIQKLSRLLVNVAIGTLLADALVHLYPEALESGSSPLVISIAALTGILLFFILEKVVHWRHSHGIRDDEDHQHQDTDGIEPYAYTVIFGDALHNFIDGLLIASAFMVNLQTGIATTVAVILHEIPQELGDFGILIHAGMKRAQALMINFLTALTSIVGVLAAYALIQWNEQLLPLLLALTAGGFLYIAGTDLLPRVHYLRSVKANLGQLITIIFGMGLVILLSFLE